MHSSFKLESDSRSDVSDSVTPWTAAHRANLCTGFSRQESSRPRDQTSVFCIPGRLFTIWAIREEVLIRKVKAKSWVLTTENTEHPVMWSCFWSRACTVTSASAYTKRWEHVNYTSDLNRLFRVDLFKIWQPSIQWAVEVKMSEVIHLGVWGLWHKEKTQMLHHVHQEACERATICLVTCLVSS